jgi:hypothetical protein
MPRKSRIDAPGALHHIIGRGIDRNRIFQDELERSLLCYWAVRPIGVCMSSMAQRLGISPTSVSQSVTRGEALALNNSLTLV